MGKGKVYTTKYGKVTVVRVGNRLVTVDPRGNVLRSKEISK